MSLIPENNRLAYEYNKQAAPRLLEICRPLFQYTPLTGFRCGKVLEGGNHILLSTRNDWAEFYFENNFPCGSLLNKILPHLSSEKYYYFFWPLEVEGFANTSLELNYSLDIWNGVNLYKKVPDGIEFWSFNSDRTHSDVRNFYLNNKSLLEDFLENMKASLLDLRVIFNPKTLPQIPDLLDLKFSDSSSMEDYRGDPFFEVLQSKKD